MAVPDPILAVMALLAADTDVAALVSGRVYGMELPEADDVSMPRYALVVTLAGGNLLTGGTWSEYGDPRFDVFAYGATRLEANQLYRAAHVALKAMTRVKHASVLLHWARPAGGPIPLRDPDTTWPYVLSTWQVLLSEVAAA